MAAWATLAASGPVARAQMPHSVLRSVPQAEPQVFDPHQSQANVTSVHAMMIYDHLFGWDANMVPRPQMVESWNKSGDGLLYTFTLRPGLTFHDATPVTTRDVIPSLKRMFIRDTQNQIFANLITSLDRVDDRTFTLRLKAPFQYVEFLLGGSNGVAGVIMREKDAMTDPFTPCMTSSRATCRGRSRRADLPVARW
jgi:peptide/nickel transport system substrate-binding protein